MLIYLGKFPRSWEAGWFPEATNYILSINVFIFTFSIHEGSYGPCVLLPRSIYVPILKVEDTFKQGCISHLMVLFWGNYAGVSHVVLYRCESWTTKKAVHWRMILQIMVLKKTLDCPLGSKEIKPVHPKGNQPWIFIGRTDAEAEVPILGPPDVKSWLIGKDANARKNWRQKEKRAAEDEMIR